MTIGNEIIPYLVSPLFLRKKNRNEKKNGKNPITTKKERDLFYCFLSPFFFFVIENDGLLIFIINSILVKN